WTVLREMKRDPALASIPVIVITMTDDRSLAYSLGASDFVRKPIDRERLAAVLKRFEEDGRAGSVLIVDDDPAVRELMSRSLAAAGWAVADAANGRMALERLEQASPDLILLDLLMPEMDGFELLARLQQKEAWSRIPVVVVTARDLTPEMLLRLGANVRKVFHKGGTSGDDLVRGVMALAPRSGAAV